MPSLSAADLSHRNRLPGQKSLAKAGLLLVWVTLPFVLSGCSTANNLQSISILPTSGTQVLSAQGQTAQFRAIGTFIHGQRPATTQDITTSVTWSSLNTAVATVSSTGVVTATGANGTATISASSQDTANVITASSSVNVNITATTSGTSVLTSLAILPGTQTLGSINETAQYIAIGTFSGTPATQDMTSSVKWSSSDATVTSINASGLATALAPGTATIVALGTASNGAVISATAGLSTVVGAINLPAVTVYKAGNNAATSSVTASYVSPSGTLTPIVCGPQASASQCSASFPVGVTVTFTAAPSISPSFGGWSANCKVLSSTAPYTCQIVTTAGDNAVGAIFD